MIHIFGKYYAEADENQVRVGVRRKDILKDGSERYVIANPSYFSTLENALRGLYKRLSLETLQSVDGELEDAIKALHALSNEFSETIDRVVRLIDALEDDGK